MSVIVKGMKMPKCCWDCLFSEFEDEEYGNFVDDLGYSYRCKSWYSCILINNSKYTELEALKGRCLNCPLVEIKPHGRLIDADAFVKEKQEWYCKQNCERRKGIKNGKECFIYKIGEAPCRACEIDDLISAVDDAPTIIEGDGT